MPAQTPWLTSDDLVNSVKLNIMFPISQSTFTYDDILAFANKEMSTSQVPSILKYHEDFFEVNYEVRLQPNQSVYPIPNRAIGLKLRDLMYRDTSQNLTEMTRITGDEDIFTYGSGSGTPPYKFKLMGNDVVLVPPIGGHPIGSLVFVYYIRPNKLVANARAAIVQNFTRLVNLNNSLINPGDTVSINKIQRSIDNPLQVGKYPDDPDYNDIRIITSDTFTAVTGTPSTNEFQIGATSIITASNLTAAINTNATYQAVASGASVSVSFNGLLYQIASSNLTGGFVVPYTTGVNFQSLPTTYLDPSTGVTDSLFVNGASIDFLQTLPGHKIRGFDVIIPSNGISNTTIQFNSHDVPWDLVVGDYICLSNECIIPQIPTELHEVLAERTSARIQKALGDMAGLQATNQQVGAMEGNQNQLIDNRAEGTPQKVLGRHTILKIMARRRSHLRGW